LILLKINGAEGENNRILNPARLPVPPPRHFHFYKPSAPNKQCKLASIGDYFQSSSLNVDCSKSDHLFMNKKTIKIDFNMLMIQT